MNQVKELDIKKALILGKITDSLSPLVDQIVEDDLSKNILNLITQLLDSFSEGKTVTVAPYDLMMGTEAAAEVVGVSRQWITKLIDRGDLPAQLIGSKRRIRLGDLMEFKYKDKIRRLAKLQDWSFLDEDSDKINNQIKVTERKKAV